MGAYWRAMFLGACLECQVAFGEGVPTLLPDKSVAYPFTITNGTDVVQTVSKTGLSCSCLFAEDIAGRKIPPGGALTFEVTFDPRGLEGRVWREAYVKLEPSGEIQRFSIEADVQVRLALEGGGRVSFGQVEDAEGREKHVGLWGHAAGNATVTGTAGPENPFFRVTPETDGRGVRVELPASDGPRLGRLVSETWRVSTDDEEIPELPLVLSAFFGSPLEVAPAVLDIDGASGCPPVLLRRSDGESFTVLAAETGPERWGTTAVVPRPLNGWRIDVAEVDGDGLRSLSADAFLQIETDCPGAESLRIPVRIGQGDRK